ncbi:MAG TPA: DUF1616 domain-containing protein [Candidatus Nanoarchaeia archaeon]|nr:DUF1616 domain-containing protein [Candidatus Nanoarchaeia archaeon]
MKNNKNAYAIAVAISLVIASILLVTFLVFDQPAQKPYMTIYLLDSNRKAADYPEFLVANVNSTFSVYVDVENFNGKTVNGAEVLVKITNETNSVFPLDVNATQTFTGNVQNAATWENIATISINNPGNYLVDFELWTPNQTGTLQFSGNFCVLNVQIAPQNTNA